MIISTNRALGQDFFFKELTIRPSDDFRCMLFVDEKYRNQHVAREHVGVAVAFNGFLGRTCAMHVVIQDPVMFTRTVLRECFHYAFVQAGLSAVIGTVDSVNTKALDLDKRIGFKEVHRIKDGGLEGDLVILQMRYDECRWLRNKGGA